MIEKLNKALNNFAVICAVALSVISLYTAFFGTFETMTQRTMHLTIICVVGLFIYRLKSASKWPLIDLAVSVVLSALIVAANLYLVLNWKELYVSPFMDTQGVLLGTIAIIILLELTRRTVGLSLSVIVIFFLLYTYFGDYIPGFLGHRGYNIERIVVQVFAGTEGIYGIPVGVCATIVIIFLIFGAFLDRAGASQVLLDLASSIAGRYRGGPAKVAIAASGLMGMVSGSSAANAATTGAITIPMMKKTGVEPRVAAAIEAVASSGGYKTPPIMGAVAFVMANMLGVDYVDVCIAAALPAFFHYMGLFFMVDFYAAQKGLSGMPLDKLVRFWPAFKAGGLFMLPVALLVVLMSLKYTAMFACAYSLLALWLVAVVSRTLSLKGIFLALKEGTTRMIPITIPCAVAGIILGILTLTGAGMKLSEVIGFLSRGNLFLTLFWIMIISIILGMGLPPVVSYLVLAALEVPALTSMGVHPMAAHLFIFYFCALSLITPPICTTAFTAAAIAEAHPMKTGLEAVRFGIVLYTLPYLFVYSPALLFEGTLGQTVFVFVKAMVGVFALAAGAQGYLFRPLSWTKRGLFVAGSVLVFWPGILVPAGGAVLLAALVLWEHRIRRAVLAS
ncbi:MAG: TRAP transporter fused permease subunit [Thermodesulfobacteriota bacterium]